MPKKTNQLEKMCFFISNFDFCHEMFVFVCRMFITSILILKNKVVPFPCPLTAITFIFCSKHLDVKHTFTHG